MKKIITVLFIVTSFCSTAQDVKNATIIFSKDGGIHWTVGDGGLPKDAIVTCYIAAGKTIFVGTESHGLFRYEGSSWSNLKGIASGRRVSAIIGVNEKLYVSTDAQGVLVSQYQGDTWNKYGASLPSDRVRRFFYVKDKLIAGGDHGIYSSRNNSPWHTITTGMQVNKFLLFGNKLYAATSSGIYCSDDEGETWNATWTRRPVFDLSIQKNKIVALLDRSDVAVLQDNDQWMEVTPFLKYLYTVHLTPRSQPVLRHDFQSEMIRNAQFHPLITFRDTAAPTYMLDTPEGLMLIVWWQVVGC